jgi:hypothetical protein
VLHDEYLRAAETLWGHAGRFAVLEYARLNTELFDGDMPPLPILIGLVAYGRCLGVTLLQGRPAPRITLPPEIFQGSRPVETAPGKYRRRLTGGENVVRDVLTHEMVHARLMLDGRNFEHNAEPWCEWITRLSPAVLGHSVNAHPLKVRRVDGKVTRRAPDGQLDRATLAGWPGTLRRGTPLFNAPGDWDPGPRIAVDHVY